MKERRSSRKAGAIEGRSRQGDRDVASSARGRLLMIEAIVITDVNSNHQSE